MSVSILANISCAESCVQPYHINVVEKTMAAQTYNASPHHKIRT